MTTQMELGERRGQLVFAGEIFPDREGRIFGRFLCDCGSSVRKAVGRVVTERTPLHCGCQTDMGKCRTHGMKGSPEYSSWQAIKRRCLVPGDKDYPRYGGAGITMCPDWSSSFSAFYEHIGPRPSGTTVDRKDPSRGYEPGNVRWATPHEQSRNRKDLTVVKTVRGEMALVDYAKALGITKGCAHLRLKRGTLEGLLT